MKKFFSATQASKLLHSGRFFTLRGSYVLQGESHPESGESFSVSFSVDSQGFAKVEGKPVRRYGLPTSKQVLALALETLAGMEAQGARIFCADQDEAFLRSVGIISPN